MIKDIMSFLTQIWVEIFGIQVPAMPFTFGHMLLAACGIALLVKIIRLFVGGKDD